MLLPYRVIYPCGDRTRLDVAYVRDYEESDWDIASRQSFEDEETARTHARDLANEHGLTLVGDPAYLD